MPKHEFGIMQKAPMPGEQFDQYEPEKYNCIFVDDKFIEPLLIEFSDNNFYWHTLDVSGKGLAYYGVTLIAPCSIDFFILKIESNPALAELKSLLLKAKAENKYVIHFGI